VTLYDDNGVQIASKDTSVLQGGSADPVNTREVYPGQSTSFMLADFFDGVLPTSGPDIRGTIRFQGKAGGEIGIANFSVSGFSATGVQAFPQ
jgi:hypothetical protein